MSSYPNFGHRSVFATSGHEGFPCAEGEDPLQLLDETIATLDNLFQTRGIAYLPGQREALCSAAEAILSASPNTVTALPLLPGSGKSTLIRALLRVVSRAFVQDATVARRLGGVVVVVEKSSEAHELADLCNQGCESPLVALVVEGPNDFVLGLGECPAGTAGCYEECPKRQCPEYDTCHLMRQASRTRETPILILLHARYANFVEDISPFLAWDFQGEERYRSLLLVDESPDRFTSTDICLRTLNDAEVAIEEAPPSSSASASRSEILFQWNRQVRTSFFAVKRLLRSKPTRSGFLTQEDRDAAGFQPEAFAELQKMVAERFPHSPAESLLAALSSNDQILYNSDHFDTLSFPRLRSFSPGPATFLFSGTAELAPELTQDPHVTMLSLPWAETFERLTIHVQRGDVLRTSKTALSTRRNRAALVAWLKAHLPELICGHKKVLLVTYQSYAAELWAELSDFQDGLIPYIDGSGHPQAKLPYFGGLNGSNLYQTAECVLCCGLPRYDPQAYLSRTIALDSKRVLEDWNQCSEQNPSLRPEQLPSVMALQDIILANDLAQLIYRCALRRHGESTPITVWLFLPPTGTLEHLARFFPGAVFQECTEVPEECRLARTIGRMYKDSETHASKLSSWLQQWDGAPITPEEIRRETGLSKKAFKEAKKSQFIHQFFCDHVMTEGSGRNTRYRKITATT